MMLKTPGVCAGCGNPFPADDLDGPFGIEAVRLCEPCWKNAGEPERHDPEMRMAASLVEGC